MYRRLSRAQREYLIALRKQGKSIPEISKETGIAKTTVQRHIRGVEVPKQFKQRLREKQGGAKERAKGLRDNIALYTKRLVGELSARDRLFLLIGLYWGEGTKRDFSVINSDPALIRTLIRCLRVLDIPQDRLEISLRMHTEISVPKAKLFWERTTGLSKDLMRRVEIIEGKKKGRLPHGMCRIRVKSGIRERLIIQTAISQIGKESSKRLSSKQAAIVQWIEQGTPKP